MWVRKINTLRLLATGIYLLKVNCRNTGTKCEICSQLTIKTSERRLSLMLPLDIFHTLCISIVNFKHVIAGWVDTGMVLVHNLWLLWSYNRNMNCFLSTVLEAIQNLHENNYILFFFYLGFLTLTFTNQRTAGEGGGHFLNTTSTCLTDN